jgi:hypothetical protein
MPGVASDSGAKSRRRIRRRICTGGGGGEGGAAGRAPATPATPSLAADRAIQQFRHAADTL